jgi:drug/metabolite transporter (DMT)-like permease
MSQQVILIAINVLLMVIGQIFFKKAGIFLNDHEGYGFFEKFLLNIWLYFGLFTFGIATLVWVKLLSIAKLSTVYPMQSFAYVLIAIISFFFFGEKISLTNSIGIGVIILGVFLVAQR